MHYWILHAIFQQIYFENYFIQGGHIKIHSHSDIPVQVDGEPWIQPPGEVVVFNSALKVSIHKVSRLDEIEARLFNFEFFLFHFAFVFNFNFVYFQPIEFIFRFSKRYNTFL